MTTAVMPLETLIPFASILGLMLVVFLVVNVVEGYEAPSSASESLKRILGSTGGWMGGFLIAHLFLDRMEFSEDILASVLGAMAAIVILFAIDMTVLRLIATRQTANGDDE